MVVWLATGSLAAQCPALGPIVGQAMPQACNDSLYTFTIPGSGPADLIWSLNPPHVGHFDGPPNGESVYIGWAYEEPVQLCATPTNPCYDPTPVCMDIEVQPSPYVDIVPDMYVCDGEQVDIHFTGTGWTYHWTQTSNPVYSPIGLSAQSGVGDISFVASNPGNTVILQGFSVNAYQGDCAGEGNPWLIFVYPFPAMAQPPDRTVCPGAVVDVPFTGGPQGTVYHWENDNPAIGLPAAGSTTTNLYFTAAQVSTQQTGTVTVTPVTGDDCAGDPVTFSITVTPSLNDPPDITVCPGEPVSVGFTGTGVNFNWTNSNPAVGLPGSGSGDLAFTATGGSQQQTATITVTPSLGPCAPVPQTFTVTVRPQPTVNQPPNLAVCAGANVTANFTGTPGTTFSWTNNNPAVGLGPSGTGNIAFTAADVGQTETATVTVTPDNGTCAGIPRTFDIRVKPLPLMLPPADATVCAESDLQVAFNGPAGATYTWTNSNPAIGLGPSGAGDIAFTAANGPQQQTATVTVTPKLEGCDGPPVSFSITVLPAPVVQVPADLSVCTGTQVTVQLTATPGASIVWTNGNPAIGLPAAGGGPIINFTAAQVDSLLSGLITVTPHGAQCTGLAQTFVITVVRCCQTWAGALDTINRTLCAPDSAFVAHFGNQSLAPGDTLLFLLYSDSLDPLGSVLWVSDSLPIPFLPGVTLPDSTYFTAAVAGPLAAPDSVDAGAACFSLVRGPTVRWVARPTAVALAPPEAVCRDGCAEVLIELKGHPPFELSWRASMAGQVLLDRTETVVGHSLLLTICVDELGPLPPGGGMLDFGAYYLADRYCGCGK